ncbi:classical arabinogalactan protein 25-like [Nicotiana tomentosiformis]|uniref:Classical arabinogalactan protein 25-like n=1 Tax=Nicotiana tabacum TaxID=4097 RepID=A0A1S3ZIV9_TOBAC|nr:classical arabinogalactan protein 25-like [Nicotiana tomentosiformis]XP_016464329.1 PREDICTED: classical arabinogalactan protein 25-like [Nicotiana tabacum]
MGSSFCFVVVATIFIMARLISATPVEFLANPPVEVASPFSEISPDIAPLLPSPGGVVPPASSVSSVPTIPSNPSKNPDDEMFPIGPDNAALAPSAFSPVSSSVCLSLTVYLHIAVFVVVGLFVNTIRV